MTQCFVCDNCDMSIFIQSPNVKEGVTCILQMLRIHTDLQKLNKKDRFHMLLRDKYTVGINRPCIMIAKNEVLFEKYRMALKQNKYAIEIQGDDEIKRNRLYFDFMLRMCDHLNQFYNKEKSLPIDTILKYYSRKDSAKENTSKPSQSRKYSVKGNISKPPSSRQ